MTKDDQITLEMLIDRHGLFSIMDAVSGICGLKAEHITHTWQDHDLASAWSDAEAVIEAAANRVLDINLDGR